MKKFKFLLSLIKKAFFTFCLLALFCLLFLAFSFWTLNRPPSSASLSYPQSVQIQEGQSLDQIALLLKSQSLIKSSLFFKFVVWAKGWSNKLQAGSFEVKQPLPSLDLANLLLSGRQDLVFTIPEGFRTEQIAQKLEKQGFLSPSQARNFITIASLLEGQLWPDTYHLPASWGEEDLLNLLIATFKQKFAQENLALHSSVLADDQLLILASVLEREGKTLSEKRKIASVILNRLDIGMPLQVDATIQYARDSLLSYQPDLLYWQPLKKENLKLDSPYNTYLNPGLPPAPICNPGKESLQAALNPSDTDYLYYLTDDSGLTHFSQTLEEHNQKVNQYLLK